MDLVWGLDVYVLLTVIDVIYRRSLLICMGDKGGRRLMSKIR